MTQLEDYFRRRRFRLINSNVEEPSNVIDSYVWDLAYDSKDALAGSWPGSPGPTLTAVATPTLNVSTTELTTIGGIGSARENKAIRANASGGFRLDDAWDVPGGVYHLRVLVYAHAAPGATEHIFYLYDATNRFIRVVRLTNGALQLYAYFGSGHSFSAFNNIHNPLAVGAWHLVDIIYDGTGGPGGVARTQWMVDGSAGATQTSATDVDMVQAGTDVNVLNTIGSGGAPSVNAVFVGRRALSSFSEFTLAQHQADVAALGL